MREQQEGTASVSYKIRTIGDNRNDGRKEQRKQEVVTLTTAGRA
jgi:hypothetical protein